MNNKKKGKKIKNKKKTSIKGQVYSSMVGSCLACARPCAPTPDLQNKKKNS
jgi:hypothetical protein